MSVELAKDIEGERYFLCWISKDWKVRFLSPAELNFLLGKLSPSTEDKEPTA